VSGPDEHDAMRQRYARRAALPAARYAPLNPEVQARVHERQRATRVLLARHGVVDLAGLDIVEVGCGSGANLLEWLQLGAEARRLVGNELLADRLEAARERLPAALRLHAGDAAELPFADASFDIVHQSTVFSSILDDAQQQRLAAAMWRWLRPGGAVLWYDFSVDNPRNPDVRGVPLARIRQLFPQGVIDSRRVTLAPPIGRAVVRVHPALYTVLNTMPWLRSHVLAWIAKP
jgi:ubiquinone/menaquinone biosynthesis C-methylase UbiE